MSELGAAIHFATLLFSMDFYKEGFFAIMDLETSRQVVSEGEATSAFVREVWKYKHLLLYGQAPLRKTFALARIREKLVPQVQNLSQPNFLPSFL